MSSGLSILDPLAAPSQESAPILAQDGAAIAAAQDLAARFSAGAAARDRDRHLPFAEVELFSRSGLWSLNVPKAYGGPGLSYVTVVEVFAIIAAADASIAQIAQNHVSLIDVIRCDPDEARKRLLLDKALRGIRFGNAQAERGGRHVLDIGTRITRSGEGFRVNGEKAYATGALFAHLVPVQAIDEDGKRVLAFVDRHAPGLTIRDDWSGFGQRTTASGTVVLQNVAVAADHVVRAHCAFDVPTVHGAVAQILHVAIDLGLARQAIRETIAFVRQAARPWCDSGKDQAAEDPFTIREIADLHVKLHAAEALTVKAARAIDRGLLNETEATSAAASIATAEAKVLTTEIALQATNKLFELSGTRSALGELGLDRFWRDARTHTLHDPVRWKAFAIGNHLVNGVNPPRHSWF